MEIIGCDYTTQLVQRAINKDKAIRDLNFFIANRIRSARTVFGEYRHFFVRTFNTYIPMTDITLYYGYFDIHVLSC